MWPFTKSKQQLRLEKAETDLERLLEASRGTMQRMALMLHPETRHLIIDDTNARCYLPTVHNENTIHFPETKKETDKSWYENSKRLSREHD